MKSYELDNKTRKIFEEETIKRKNKLIKFFKKDIDRTLMIVFGSVNLIAILIEIYKHFKRRKRA